MAKKRFVVKDHETREYRASVDASEVRKLFYYTGDEIEVFRKKRTGNGGACVEVKERYKVLKTYRDFVLVTNGKYRQCFSKSDLFFGRLGGTDDE